MKKTILIVEDEENNLILIRDLLQVLGYSTIEATDGKQGIELANRDKPDLILMDIQLPKMDGIEAMQVIKSDPSTNNILIIALTSFAMKGDREKLLDAGFDGYISKPIDIKEFQLLIAEYVRE